MKKKKSLIDNLLQKSFVILITTIILNGYSTLLVAKVLTDSAIRNKTSTESIIRNVTSNAIGVIQEDDFTGENLNDYTIIQGRRSIALQSGELVLSGDDNGQFDSYISFSKATSPFKVHALEKWRQEVKFVMPAITSTSYGISVGIRSTNQYTKIDNLVRLAMDNVTTLGSFHFYSNINYPLSIPTNEDQQGSFALTSGTTYVLEVEMNKLTLTAKLWNDDKSILLHSATKAYNIATASQIWPHNVGSFTIWGHGGTVRILQWKTYSDAERNVDVVYLTDSNGRGLYAQTAARRYCEAASVAGHRTYEIIGGIDQGIADIVSYKDLVLFINPKIVYLNVLSNDVANGTSPALYRMEYQTLVHDLESAGIKVVLGYPAARNNVDIASEVAWINATFQGNRKVDIFSATKNINDNNLNPTLQIGDDIHLNGAGNDACTNLIFLDQAITFSALPSKIFGDADFTLNATTSSTLALSYTSSNPNVATISGNTVTIIGPGTSTITAFQAGNENYNAAVDVMQTLTVYKADQTITFNTIPSTTFGDADFTLNATTSSTLALSYMSSNPSVATVSGNILTIIGAGTSIITALQSGNANYNSAPDVAQTVTVNKADQTISFNQLPTKTFGDANFTLNTITSSGLEISYTIDNTSVATIIGNTVTIVGAGTAMITASQGGNTNYNAALDVTQVLTVNKADQTITFAALSDTPYSRGSISFSATSTSGLPVAFSSSDVAIATVSGSEATFQSPGRVTFSATQEGNTNYNAAATVSYLICIVPPKPAVTSDFSNPSIPVLTSSAVVGNQWYLNGTPLTGATQSTYAIASAGTYTTQATISECTSPLSDETIIVVTGVESHPTTGLYPNPAEREITLSTEQTGSATIQIISSTGEVVKELERTVDGELTIGIEGLSTGVYLLKVKQASHTQTIRFVKK